MLHHISCDYGYMTKPFRHSQIQKTQDTKIKGQKDSGNVSLTEADIFAIENTFSAESF